MPSKFDIRSSASAILKPSRPVRLLISRITRPSNDGTTSARSVLDSSVLTG